MTARNVTADRYTVLYALSTGKPEDIEALRGHIPWDEMAKAGGVPRALHNVSGAYAKGVGLACMEDAMVVLLAMAAEEGRTEVFKVFSETGKHPLKFPQPLRNLIETGYERALEIFIKSGMDPHGKRGSLNGAKISAIELAHHYQRPGTAAMMAAAAQRLKVDKVLAAASKRTRAKP